MDYRIVESIQEYSSYIVQLFFFLCKILQISAISGGTSHSVKNLSIGTFYTILVVSELLFGRTVSLKDQNKIEIIIQFLKNKFY